MKVIFKKLMNRETITYLIFGVLTTLVDLAVFWGLKKLLGEEWVLLINAIAFLAAASFAYVTNKLWVFESRSWAPEVLKKEIPMFFAARVFSFLFTEAGLWFSKDVLHAGAFKFWKFDGLDLAKVLLSVVVVILNYVFSKLFIFRKKPAETGEAPAAPEDAGEPSAAPEDAGELSAAHEEAGQAPASLEEAGQPSADPGRKPE